MYNKTIDVCSGIFLSLLSIAIYLYAEQQYVGSGVNRYGPNFFPQVVSVMLLLASLTLIYQALKGNSLKNFETINKKGFIRTSIVLGFAIAYLFLMQVAGFYLATGIFLFVTMKFLGLKSYLVTLIVSACVATIVFGIFKVFLKIPLPEGLF